ncbi:hypothetical protein A361_20470 [Cytobacillus oceanisediminis 2691]|uniref:pPIWI-RE three-gene island domain-containing protein n=2 Tax=Cytobacillus oceanisediminis TaxID=665099 RepID=A0A169FW57_9BACI|nr:hypothetical protein A361_20470 [Cytobacillus oceanisediminis 2691]
MFKSFSDVSRGTLEAFSEEVRNLNNEDLSFSPSALKKVLLVELTVYAFEKSFGSEKATIDNVWSVFPNYKSLYPASQDEASIEIIRIFFGSNFSHINWKDTVREYLRLDNFIRMYRLGEDEKFIQKSVSVFTERLTHYKTLLNPKTVMPTSREYPPFLTKDKIDNIYFYSSSDSKKNNIKKYMMTTEGGGKRAVPEHLVKEENILKEQLNELRLPQQRKKVPFEILSTNIDEETWKTTAQYINEFIQANKQLYTDEENSRMRDWTAAADIFKLTPTNPTSNKFLYKDKVSIGGIVGAGKSTFLQLELFRLKQLKAKTAVMTVNVVDTLELVYKLHLVGLKAVPLIGKRNMAQHLKNFIKKVKREAARDYQKNPLSELSLQYVLQFFSGVCTAEILADAKESTGSPCVSLYHHDEQFSCPMFDRCGKYTVERQLADADVWVGTQSAFIHTKPNVLVNPYDFTYAELAYEMMDVIYVDEADSVQEAVDGSFLSQNILLGNKDALFDNSFLAARNTLDKRYDFSSSKTSKEWRHFVNETSKVAHYLYELIQDSAYIRREVKNYAFGHHQLLSKITKSLFKKVKQVAKHPFYETMITVDFPNSNEKGDMSLEKVIRKYIRDIDEVKIYSGNAIEQKKQEQDLTEGLLNKILVKYDYSELSVYTGMKEVEKKQLLLLFQFYIYLINFDSHFKYLLKIKHQVENILGEEIPEISSVFKNVKRFLPFLPYAATGRSFQYFFRETHGGEEGSVGTFRTYDYLAVGRHFLMNFSNLFENITQKRDLLWSLCQEPALLKVQSIIISILTWIICWKQQL